MQNCPEIMILTSQCHGRVRFRVRVVKVVKVVKVVRVIKVVRVVRLIRVVCLRCSFYQKT